LLPVIVLDGSARHKWQHGHVIVHDASHVVGFVDLVVVVVVLILVVVIVVVAVVDVVAHDVHHVKAGKDHGDEAECVETATYKHQSN
jgi:uncharacterized membrane protein